MSPQRLICWATTALAITLMCVASTQAQRQGKTPGRSSGPPGSAFGIDPLSTLSDEKVQVELDLTVEQKDGLAKLTDERRSGQRDALASDRKLSGEQQVAKAEARRKEYQKKAEALLSPKQVERLKQIGFQKSLRTLGANALLFDDAAKALNLTDGQKNQLERIAAAMNAKRGQLFQGFQGTPSPEFTAKVNALQKEEADKMLAVLNADQKSLLETLKGKKFERAGDMGGAGGSNQRQQP